MPRKYIPPLAVERMSNAQLWKRVTTELVTLDGECMAGGSPTQRRYALNRLRLCIYEIKLRGVQLRMQESVTSRGHEADAIRLGAQGNVSV